MKELSYLKPFYFSICLCLLISFFAPLNTKAFTLGTSNKNTLTNGLIGYWSFDSSNVTNGRVNDLSGNGYHGNLRNIASTTFYTLGKMGQGFNFDGVDDYIDLGTASQSMLNGASVFTYSVWFKTNNATRQVLMGNSDGASDDSFAIELNSTGGGVTNDNRIQISGKTNPNLDLTTYTSSDVSPSLYNNSWHHVVTVLDLNTKTSKIYYDGILQNISISENAIGSSFGAFDQNIYLGGLNDLGVLSQPFRGVMDEVRVYNRELSATEAKQLYNLGQSKLSFGNTNFLPANLKAHWTFDGNDIVSGIIRDLSGNGNNGIPLNHSTSTFYTTGKIGQGLNFDGSDDYVSIASSASIDDIWTSGGTISFWVKPDSAGESDSGYWINKGSRYTIFARSNHTVGETGMDVIIQWSGGNATWRLSSTNPPISFGKWNHVVFMYNSDSTANDPIVYVNGVNIGGLGEVSSPVGTITSDSGVTLTLGSNSVTTRSSDGIMDDVRMYDKILSEAEIKNLYLSGLTKFNTSSNNLYAPANLNTGLINHWTFDGPDFTDKVYDRVGGENGYIIGGGTSTAKTIGVIGQAGGLTPGSSLYYDFSEVTSIENLNELSVSMWIRATTTSVSLDTPILGNQTNSNQRVFVIARGASNIISATVRTTGNAASNSGATNIADRRWHHIGFVYNGSTISVYVDGVQSGTPAAQTGLTMDTFGTLKLSNIFADDLRIYNRALSAAEMKALYNYGK